MFLPAISRNSSQYEEMRNKSLLFVSKLKEKSREWYVNAYLEYVMSWELYGLVTFPVDVLLVLGLSFLAGWTNRLGASLLTCSWNAWSFYPGFYNSSREWKLW